jgi:hypothetical protein
MNLPLANAIAITRSVRRDVDMFLEVVALWVEG